MFRLFNVVHVPESVLRELRLPPAVDWAAVGLAVDKMALFTETSDVEATARRILAESSQKPVKRIDYPEAVCLAAGVKFGYVVKRRGLLRPAYPRAKRCGVEGLRGNCRGLAPWVRGGRSPRTKAVRRGDVPFI